MPVSSPACPRRAPLLPLPGCRVGHRWRLNVWQWPIEAALAENVQRGTCMTRLAVVAIGGNSLIKDGAHQTVPDQWNAVRETATHIAAMIGQGWNVVVTHGNGPQVGFILLRSELSRNKLHPVPLDSCGADTQGAIGYMIQLALHNEFRRRGINRQAATIVTQVLVDASDPAIQRPSKPIGPFYSEEQARELQAH